MSEEWVDSTLGEVAQWGAGGTPKAGEPAYYENGTIPWAVIGDIQDGPIATTERHITEAGVRLIGHLAPAQAVLVTMYGTIGRVALTQCEMATNQAIAWGVADPRLLTPQFLFHWMRNYQPTLDALARGATQRNINRAIIKESPIKVPPLRVQRRIVDLMTHLEEHLANLSTERDRVANLALEVATAHFTSDAVSLVPLSELITLRMDFHKVEPEGAFRMAGVLNQGKGLIDKGVVAGSATQYARLNRLRAGDIVMRKLTAWEGPIAVVPQEFDGSYVSTEFPTFSVDSARLDLGFADMLCQWPGLWSEMRQRVTGTVMRRKRLSPEQLLSVTVPVSEVALQCQIAETVSAARATAADVSTEIERLERFRRALLPLLLGGEMQLPTNYDALVADVA